MHANESKRGEGNNIKNYERELDLIIEKLTKRVKWYLTRLESVEGDLIESNRTSDAFSKLASMLVKFLEFKGYRFDANANQEHILDLLQKLDHRTRKKVEEVIKFERTKCR
ncbi:MAG: hypothetical protein QXU32_11875 [Nitrososphaerales archaeon]